MTLAGKDLQWKEFKRFKNKFDFLSVHVLDNLSLIPVFIIPLEPAFVCKVMLGPDVFNTALIKALIKTGSNYA